MYYVAKIRENKIVDIFSAKSDSAAIAVGISLMASNGITITEQVRVEFGESGSYEHGDVTYCWGEAQSYA